MRVKDAPRVAPPGFSLRAATLTLALLAPALGGCVTQATQIEQGRAISTGKQPYDQFFEAVRTLREVSLRAEQQAVDGRADLARTLGLDVRSNAESTLDAARERADKLRESGVLLHIELTPDAKLVSTRGRRPLKSEDKRLIEAIETSAKTSLDVSKQLGALSKRAAELESRRATLAADSNTIFANDPKRREVAREIEAAGRVLTESGELGDRYAGIASRFVLDLAHAVETGASSSSNHAPVGPPAAVRPAAPAKGAPRRSGAATPKPRPAPQPRGGDDFDP